MNKIVIKNKTAGALITAILKQEKQLNFNLIQTALRKKDVKVDGKRVKDNINLVGGEEIELFLLPAKEKEIPVVFEDDNILIANKPQGMEVTVKDKVFDKSKCLEEYFKPYRAVHRLDKNTEGLVMLAKTDNAYNAMVAGFKTNSISKHYLALVAGVPKPDKANLTDYLVKGDKEVKMFSTAVENSVLVKTNYFTLNTNHETTLLDVELLTGKTHQIRAHLAQHKIFIVGDEKYGSKTVNKKFHKHIQCLCAYHLGFRFPKENFLNYLNAKTFQIKPTFDLLSKKTSQN